MANFLLAVTLVNAASYLGFLGVAWVITAAILFGFDRLVRRYPASLIGLLILGLIIAAFAALIPGTDYGQGGWIAAYIVLALTVVAWWAIRFRQQIRGQLPAPDPSRLPIGVCAFSLYFVVGGSIQLAYGRYGSAASDAVLAVGFLALAYWRFRIRQQQRDGTGAVK